MWQWIGFLYSLCCLIDAGTSPLIGSVKRPSDSTPFNASSAGGSPVKVHPPLRSWFICACLAWPYGCGSPLSFVLFSLSALSACRLEQLGRLPIDLVISEWCLLYPRRPMSIGDSCPVCSFTLAAPRSTGAAVASSKQSADGYLVCFSPRPTGRRPSRLGCFFFTSFHWVFFDASHWTLQASSPHSVLTLKPSSLIPSLPLGCRTRLCFPGFATEFFGGLF